MIGKIPLQQLATLSNEYKQHVNVKKEKILEIIDKTVEDLEEYLRTFPEFNISNIINILSDEYINPTLVMYNHLCKEHYLYIFSFETFFYSYYNQSTERNLFGGLQRYQKISRSLRGETEMHDEDQKLCEYMRSLINNAPPLDYNITVYRCIDKELTCKVGDIITHDAFLITSDNVRYTKLFLCDVSKCYTTNRGNIGLIRPATSKGTMFIIDIPAGTKFIDNYPSFNIDSSEHELLFDYGIKLKVDKIEDTETYIKLYVSIL